MIRFPVSRWQLATISTLFVGYAGYYLCRTNLSVATPLLLEEFAGKIGKSEIGAVASIGLFVYAIGKFVNGSLADYLGGRRVFLLGMIGSVACTLLFGVQSGLLLFTLTWAANRYLQSMGWGALVKVSSRWFPVAIQGTVMGTLSASYLLGDSLVRLYLGSFISLGVGWRILFFIAAGTLAAIALGCTLTLKGSPKEVGEPEPAANPENVFGEAGDSTRPDGLGGLYLPLLRDFNFWLICLMSAGLTLVRETLNFWTPTYLVEVAGLSKGLAAQGSMVFPFVGTAAAILGGVVTDRLGGRHGRIVVPSLLALTAAMAVLGGLRLDGRPYLALALVAAIALCMMAPYSFLTGVMALDLGGKRGSATAAGLVDSAGYLGAILSGYGVGALAESRGWSVAFITLAGTSALTATVGVLYCLRQEIRARSAHYG